MKRYTSILLAAAMSMASLSVSAQTVQLKSDNVKITGGTITGTTVSKVTITAPATSATLTIANGKTATVSNSLTLAGTDSTTMTFPATNASVARTDAAQTFTGLQTFSTGITNTGNINTSGEFRRSGTPGAAGYMINQLNAGSNGNGLYWNGTGTVSGVVDGGVVTDMTTTGLSITGKMTSTTLVVTASSSPASNAACTAGTITWDTGFIYVCTASGAWKRAALIGIY